MMWLESSNKPLEVDSADESDSGDEIPIWVRGEQRWVSGITQDTLCQDVINVLVKDEEARGKHVSSLESYHITERWRGVEQPLDPLSSILDVWNAWGAAQLEVKISLRRVKNYRSSSRRLRYKSDSSIWSDKAAWKTIHPKRLNSLQNEKEPTSTEELLKLVLVQGEVIRRQLKKLRNSEQQIGFFEDKTHKARVRKHGSNYLLETYLKGLPDLPVQTEEVQCTDKNSDSGVMTEGDSEQSNNKNNPPDQTSLERLSPSSEDFAKTSKDDDTSSSVSEATIKNQVELFEMISKLNKRLLKQEECLVRLDANIRKYDKHKSQADELSKALTNLRAEMTKSSCELQHNEIVLEETSEMLQKRLSHLDALHRDMLNEDRENEMLQALLYSAKSTKNRSRNNKYMPQYQNQTKELLDTLV